MEIFIAICNDSIPEELKVRIKIPFRGETHLQLSLLERARCSRAVWRIWKRPHFYLDVSFRRWTANLENNFQRSNVAISRFGAASAKKRKFMSKDSASLSPMWNLIIRRTESSRRAISRARWTSAVLSREDIFRKTRALNCLLSAGDRFIARIATLLPRRSRECALNDARNRADNSAERQRRPASFVRSSLITLSRSKPRECAREIIYFRCARLEAINKGRSAEPDYGGGGGGPAGAVVNVGDSRRRSRRG